MHAFTDGLLGKFCGMETRTRPDLLVAVLFDRDGTAIHDIPCNRHPFHAAVEVERVLLVEWR
jgi:hypothetical protein